MIYTVIWEVITLEHNMRYKWVCIYIYIMIVIWCSSILILCFIMITDRLIGISLYYG